MKDKREVDLFSCLASAVSNNVKLMSEQQTVNALKLYINTGNPNGFTSREGTRDFLLRVPNNEVEKIIGIPVEAFVKQFVNLNKNSTLGKMQENNYNNNNNNNKIVIIKEALAMTVKKYKNINSDFTNEQAYAFVYNSIDRLANHDFTCITRDNELRQKVENILNEMNTNEFYGNIKLYLDGFRYEVANLDELRTAFSNIVIQSCNLIKNDEISMVKKM